MILYNNVMLILHNNVILHKNFLILKCTASTCFANFFLAEFPSLHIYCVFTCQLGYRELCYCWALCVHYLQSLWQSSLNSFHCNDRNKNETWSRANKRRNHRGPGEGKPKMGSVPSSLYPLCNPSSSYPS